METLFESQDNSIGGEVIHTRNRRVACDGGASGHPRVWLNLGEEGQVTCPYCSRLYVLDSTPDEAGRE